MLKTVHMKLLTCMFLLVAYSSQGQSLFKAIPKPIPHFKAGANGIEAVKDPTKGFNYRLRTDATTVIDSTFVGFRFVGPTVLYALPNSTVFTGAGIAYEHDTYRSAAGKWYTDWSVNLEGYAGGQFAPKDVSGVAAVGLSVSFFNKLLTVGVLYNLTTRKIAAGVGPTVSLNN